MKLKSHFILHYGNTYLLFLVFMCMLEILPVACSVLHYFLFFLSAVDFCRKKIGKMGVLQPDFSGSKKCTSSFRDRLFSLCLILIFFVATVFSWTCVVLHLSYLYM